MKCPCCGRYNQEGASPKNVLDPKTTHLRKDKNSSPRRFCVDAGFVVGVGCR